MVGLDNPLHIALVLIVVLMVFGAKRLPEMGKSMGEGLRGFKDSLQGHAPAEEVTSGPMLTAAVHEPLATTDATPVSTPVATPVSTPVATPVATPFAAQSTPPAA
jgi:sec-independent protein translocase protein TatA